ncbi:MAG TPA: ATP-binding protein [Pseudonocardia sp.]|nr:ATP-binding protein [Pseudonocardia sp.]
MRPDPAKRWTLRRIFAFGAACAALITIGAIALGTAALLRLSDARVLLLDQVGPAVLAAQNLPGDLVDQETAVRGFVIGGGNAAFLDPYQEGRAAEDRDVAAIRGYLAIRDDPTVAADLAAVEAAADAWRAEYVQPLLDRAPTAPDPGQGKALFDDVRNTTSRLQADLNAERMAARDGLATAATRLAWVGVGVAVMVAGFLIAAAFGLRRSVLRPVSALASQVRLVASGDTTHPVVADGPREIVNLGADVDSMRLAILHELEAAREANQQLDDQAQDLERSNRDLEQFAYVASHDLQEPLRKVASFCQLLQRRYAGKLDDRADQYIAFAVDGAERMQALINDLLSFSRVGRTTAAFSEVALDDVVAAARAQLEPARTDVDGTIELEPLPVVCGDSSLLRALFVNLIGNGLKFHREGVPPRVVVAAERIGDEWEVTVSDNGIGIDPEYIDKVFVIFQRLHARDVYAGTGIGLALAKKIVEFHGGRIGIDPPRPEPGTTLRLTLPAPRETPTP